MILLADTTNFVLTGQLKDVEIRIKRELDKISDSAQTNAIEKISIDGTEQTVTNNSVALDLSAYAKKSDVASAVRFKGSVANFDALPSDAIVGDMYNITNAGGSDENGVPIKAHDNLVKTQTGWDNFGGNIDLSNYVQKDGTKGLSSNDYTDAEKTKLAGISDGAQVNLIEVVQVNGSSLPISSKTVNIDTSGKADKVSNATNGHIAALDTNGNLVDSGYGVATDADISAMLTEVFGTDS